ncbi:hypothetical protein ACLOJK_013961 [Asimina triloba]
MRFKPRKPVARARNREGKALQFAPSRKENSWRTGGGEFGKMIAAGQSHFHLPPAKLESHTSASSSCCCRRPHKLFAIHKPTTRRNILLFTLPISTSLLLFSNPTPLSYSSPLPNFDPVSPSEKDASEAFSQRFSVAFGLLDRGRDLQAQGDFNLALQYFTRDPLFISGLPSFGGNAFSVEVIVVELTLRYEGFYQFWGGLISDPASFQTKPTTLMLNFTGEHYQPLSQITLQSWAISHCIRVDSAMNATWVVNEYKDLAFSDYARVGRALALYEVGDRDEAIAEMEDVSISLKGYPEVHAALAAALYADRHAPLLAENQFTIATLLDPHYTDISYVREKKHWPPSLVSSLQHFITLS